MPEHPPTAPGRGEAEGAEPAGAGDFQQSKASAENFSARVQSSESPIDATHQSGDGDGCGTIVVASVEGVSGLGTAETHTESNDTLMSNYRHAKAVALLLSFVFAGAANLMDESDRGRRAFLWLAWCSSLSALAYSFVKNCELREQNRVMKDVKIDDLRKRLGIQAGKDEMVKKDHLKPTYSEKLSWLVPPIMGVAVTLVTIFRAINTGGIANNTNNHTGSNTTENVSKINEKSPDWYEWSISILPVIFAIFHTSVSHELRMWADELEEVRKNLIGTVTTRLAKLEREANINNRNRRLGGNFDEGGAEAALDSLSQVEQENRQLKAEFDEVRGLLTELQKEHEQLLLKVGERAAQALIGVQSRLESFKVKVQQVAKQVTTLSGELVQSKSEVIERDDMLRRLESGIDDIGHKLGGLIVSVKGLFQAPGETVRATAVAGSFEAPALGASDA